MNTFFYKDIAYPDGVIGGKDYYNPVIYSTTERVIGVWEDNKPLYQKTLVIYNSSVVDSDRTITTIDSTFRVKNWKAFSVENGVTYKVPYVAGTGNASFYFRENGNVEFTIRNTSFAAGSYFYITIEYTKTTDTAGSAPYNNNGVPTVRYSTDEQIIGLWADGKPLYRKTWTGLSSPTNGNEWTTLQGVDASLWDEIIKMQLYTYVNNKLTNVALSEYRAFNGVTQISLVSSVFDRTVNVATIEYTKTTD